MPQPIVHAGLHKTGSSSIQVALSQSTSTRDRRLFLPVEGASQSDEEWRKRLLALAAEPRGLLSDENLLGSPFDGYALAIRRIELLRDALGGHPMSFVAYVRPQTTWLQSLYLQGVQEGKSQSPGEFLELLLNAPNLRWSVLGTAIRHGLDAGRLDLRVYKPRDVVDDFFSSQGLGSPPRLARNGIRVNRSIAPIQGPVLRNLLSDPELDLDDKVRIRRVFQDELSSGAPAGYSSFSETQQRAIGSVLEEDMASLAAGDLMPPQALEAYGQEVTKLQSEPLLPWAESAESSETLQLETFRCVGLLADSRAGKSAALRRVMDRIRADPLAIPYSVGRKLRRLGSGHN